MLCLAAVAGSAAQTNLLTLAGVKQLAFAQNWNLLAAESSVDAAEALLIMAREFPNPTACAVHFQNRQPQCRHLAGQRPLAA